MTRTTTDHTASAPAHYTDIEVGDTISFTTNRKPRRSGTVTRASARRITVACTDGSTAHITPASAPSRDLTLYWQRTPSVPTDANHANALLRHTPAFRATNTLNRQAAHNYIQGNLHTALAQFRTAARLRLSYFATPNRPARQAVQTSITTAVRDAGLPLERLVTFLSEAKELLDDVCPSSPSTDTWQVTNMGHNIIGHVTAPTNEEASRAVVRTFHQSELNMGFYLRRLSADELPAA